MGPQQVVRTLFMKFEVWERWISINGGAGTAFPCVQWHFNHWINLWSVTHGQFYAATWVGRVRVVDARPTVTFPANVGTHSPTHRGMARLSSPGWLVIHTEIVYPPEDGHPSRH